MYISSFSRFSDRHIIGIGSKNSISIDTSKRLAFYEKDLATVVEIPDMGIQGRGTVTFDFF